MGGLRQHVGVRMHGKRTLETLVERGEGVLAAWELIRSLVTERIRRSMR